jgi:hypothetical protein
VVERVRPASSSSGRDLVECDEEERVTHLGEKVKRLESLLAKCKVRVRGGCLSVCHLCLVPCFSPKAIPPPPS